MIIAIEYNYINPDRYSIKDIINNTINERIRKYGNIDAVEKY